VFDEVGGFEESFRNVFEDQAFYAKVWSRTIVYVTDVSWSLYRQHPGQSCATAAREGKLEQARQEFLRWLTGYLHSQGLPEQDLLARESSDGAEIVTGSLEDALKQISDLEQGKTWLEEQWSTWKGIAEERDEMIRELKAWIETLQQGKLWLEGQANNWQNLAEKWDAEKIELKARIEELEGQLRRLAAQVDTREEQRTQEEIVPLTREESLSSRLSRWLGWGQQSRRIEKSRKESAPHD
jgi:chromosome segregation ATPase